MCPVYSLVVTLCSLRVILYVANDGSRTSVTSVTQNHFYSINANEDHETSYHVIQYHEI